MKTLIFGHKNPDTDTICSSLAYAMYKKSKNEDVEAVKLGDLNQETKYVFDYLNIEIPRTIESIENEQKVIMIDHNEFNQSVENIENADIIEVIDHHRVANFCTQKPLKINMQPVGCSATIIYEIINQENGLITKEIATLLLSAIISDSLLFKSPTCCEKDRNVANELAKIAEVNIEEYGFEMLKAGMNLDAYSINEVLNLDAKQFDTNIGKIMVSQINTIDENEHLDKIDQYIDEIKEIINKNKINGFIFMVTNILEEYSECIVVGCENDFERIFKVNLKDNHAKLDGVLSRKKQIIPFL